MLSVEITAWLAALVDAAQCAREVWLLGSRANNSATATSDWDFLIFVEEGAREIIERLRHFHREDVDLLVVDGDSFERAWGSPPKTGSLSSWKWVRQGPLTATYESLKWVPDEDIDDLPSDIAMNLGRMRAFQLNANRVWP